MSNSSFSDDEPKTNPWTEDLLGFKPFSERLSSSIIGLNIPNGYVIGLQGSWGSGKSTALNFVKAFIDKNNTETIDETKKITIIDFKPWIVSGHQDLIASFFKIITEKLATKNDAWKKDGKKVLRALKENVDPLVDAVATVGLVLAPGLGAGSKIASAVAKKTLGSTLDGWLAEPSLQSAYEDLYDKISNAGSKFLVVIDDIDRLDKSEIRSVMQMVKTVGRLPNVIYLLSYDRNIVWPALDEISSRTRNGPNYAEKIVQQEINLPTPSRNNLFRILDAEIGFLADVTPNSARWFDIVRHGIHRWIRYPRDVARFANALKFSWPAVGGEMDPQDLIAMEGLRLFEQNIFNWIRNNRDFLLHEGRFLHLSKNEEDQFVKRMIESIDPEDRYDQISLLCILFPPKAKLLREKHNHSVDELYYQLAKRRGIGTKGGFDTYFSLFPSSKMVAKSSVDNFVAGKSDINLMLTISDEYIDKTDDFGAPLIDEFLNELQYRFYGSDGEEPTITLIQALTRIGEKIQNIEVAVQSLSMPPRVRLELLLTDLIERFSGERKFSVIQSVFEMSESLSLLCGLWLHLGKSLKIFPQTGPISDNIVSKEELDSLGSILLTLIEDKNRLKTLSEEPVFHDLFLVWSHLTQPDAVENWILKTVPRDPIIIYKIARTQLGYSVEGSGRRYHFSSRDFPPYYPAQALIGFCKTWLGKGVFDDDQTLAVRAFQEGIERNSATLQQP